MQWLFREKKKLHYPPLNEVLILEQLNIIEDKLDYLIQGNNYLTEAYDALKAEIGVAVADIAALSAKIATSVSTTVVTGTADADLLTLTTALKAATDAVDAVLNPKPAPVDTPAAAPAA